MDQGEEEDVAGWDAEEGWGLKGRFWWHKVIPSLQITGSIVSRVVLGS